MINMGKGKSKLITFIGTSDYKKCVYTRPDGFKARPSRYVQIALYDMLLHEGEEIDEVYLFITKEAEAKNYADNVTWNGVPYKGLKNMWAQYFPDDVDKLNLVYISSEQGEQDQWELFEQIYSVVNENDELYFDITHSFRSTPMIALLVANFAKTIQGASIKRLLYGNFEALFKLGNIDDVPVEKRLAPIVDLTTMLNLLDWTTGVQAFIETGNPRQMDQLAEEKVKESKGDKNIISVRQLTNSLSHLNNCMETSRGVVVHKAPKHVRKNLATVKGISDEVMPQFSKLISEIESKVEMYTDDQSKNMWATIKWCVDHGLHQQAATFAREYIVSVVCARLEEKKLVPETTDNNSLRGLREEVSRVIQGTLNPEETPSVSDPAKYGSIIDPVIDIVQAQENAFKSFQTIVNYRNNMNHAEKAQEELSYQTIQKNMDVIVENIKPIFFDRS